MPRLKTFSLSILLLSTLLLFSTSLTAQQNQTVQLAGTRLRAPLDLPAGLSNVQLCGLQPGQVYTVLALGAAQGQAATFELTPAASLRQSARDLTALPGKKAALRFTAPSECVDLQLLARSTQAVTSIPLYLSVKCESCPEENVWADQFRRQSGQAVLQVQDGISAADLITNTLIGGDCFGVTNITAFGNSTSRGTFSNGDASIDIANGMVLCTGDVDVLPGPNDQGNASAGFGNNSPDDPDLDWLATGNQYDLSRIEFDFTPTASGVQFEFVFGSEEYCEYVGTQFNDVFGFFISGPGIPGSQNLALVSAGVPVSINTVNYQTNSAFYVDNDPFSAQCFTVPDAALFDIQLDGWTIKLTASAQVIPCSTYHIKLAIADVGDGLWDSGVFLRANSFDAGGAIAAAAVYAGDSTTAFENCGNNFIRFSRGTGDDTQPLTVNFTVSSASTATAGVDYAPLSSPVTIPAGEEEILIPISVFADSLAEGTETIVLLIDNSCSCTQASFEFFIQDQDSLQIELADLSICADTTGTLTVDVISGTPPFTYAWSSGQNTPSITVDSSGTYSVTVTDLCGQVQSASAQVSLGDVVQVTNNISFCPGESVTINGITYTQSITVTDTLPGACDTVVTYNLQLLPNSNFTDTIGLCPGATVLIDGVAYGAPNTVVDTIPGSGNACDTIATYVLLLLPNTVLNDTLQFCPGSSVTIGGVVYTQPGTVLDTLPGANGACDTLVTYMLQLLPQITRVEEVPVCPGGSVTINGIVYTPPATVLDTIAGMNGACDTIVTYNVFLSPQITSQDTIALCPGDTIAIGGIAYVAPNTVVDTIPGLNGACDTIATYVLEALPLSTINDTFLLCPGSLISLGGLPYSAPATVVDTIQGSGGSCDIIATYVLQLLPQPTGFDTISVCPGDSVSIGGQFFTAPGTAVDTIPGLNGACDTIITYTLELLPQPVRFDTVAFCPGDSVNIGGNFYTTTGTVLDTLSGNNGACDTIVTYTLLSLTPAPSIVKVVCPPSVGVTGPAGTPGEVVTYGTPDATSDCPCPGIAVDLTQGLASGSMFPLGVTNVCYTAQDSCGNSASCCFTVTVNETPPCDIKQIGCMKWELLTITQDAQLRRTYRIRVTNFCDNKLSYTIFQLPNGVVADAPVDGSIFTAPSGRQYLVRNPNFSPFYSIRYKSQTDSLSNGQSDILQYTLPPQSQPAYIHVGARLEPKVYYEAHLNTFHCPIGITPQQRGESAANGLRVYPNPTDGLLFADLLDWEGERVQVRVFDGRGQRVLDQSLVASAEPQAVALPEGLASGIYFLEIIPADGLKQVVRFVLQQ